MAYDFDAITTRYIKLVFTQKNMSGDPKSDAPQLVDLYEVEFWGPQA